MAGLRFPAAIVAALAMIPLTAAAATTPAPNPSLDSVLVAPPSKDFNELTTSPLHGKFTAQEWANLGGNTSLASQTVATLNRDGFVDGFGKTWTQASSGHALIEAVMAFSGGRGAHAALSAMEAGDKSDSSYKNADTIAGLGTYYGAHFVDSSNQVVEDFFGFVKGNDVFGIEFVSSKDDVLSAAGTQAQAQYHSAPDSTIPSSQWPENAPNSAAFDVGRATGDAIVVILIIGLVGLVVGLIVRGQRRARMAAAYAGAGGGYAPMSGVQLSPDGNYWWDGQTWRDAAHEAPPYSQRSGDGGLWWDGRTWRPVPQSPPQQQPPVA